MPQEHSGELGALRIPAKEDHESRDELELVRRAAGGDEAAFRALYDAQLDFVLRTCMRLGLHDADAEDAAQETFAVASRNLARFTSGRFSTWLFRIAANIVSGKHRRRRVRDALLTLWRPREEQRSAPPDRELDRKEAAREVSALLARMSPKKREVFALYELESLSGEEIAERVGCPVATVWTRLHHARLDFAKLARKARLLSESGPGAQRGKR